MKLLFAIILILPVANCFGQNYTTDSTTTVVPYWQKGDIANYTLSQVKEQYENRKLQMRGSSTSDIEIKVLFANTDSYILNWKYRDIKVEGLENEDENQREFATLVKGINFIYKISKAGEFQELVNWAEVQAAIIKIIDKILNSNKDADLNSALQQARKVFSTKESIESTIMKDMQVFHAIYGGEYPLNQKLGADTQLPNMLGGDPFPAKVELELVELNLKASTCKIKVDQKVEKEKAIAMINAMQGKPANTKSTIDISDISEYEIELARGWVTKLSNIRSSEINGMKSVEKLEWKKVN